MDASTAGSDYRHIRQERQAQCYGPMEQREQKPNLFGLCRNIVQTRAESSLLGYAECSRYSTKVNRDRGRQHQPMEQREERPSLLLSTASKRAATVSH